MALPGVLCITRWQCLVRGHYKLADEEQNHQQKDVKIHAVLDELHFHGAAGKDAR